MKDEEMAEERKADYGIDLCCYCRECDVETLYPCQHKIDAMHGYKDGFLAGLKAGRPQWHDLQKDKNDLPKGYAENTRFLCSVKGETLFLVRYGSFWQGNFKVDAWCEIPTFDKE